MERSVYIYRNADGFEPVVLSLSDDGDVQERKTTCPCGQESSAKLQLIGHLYEREEVCFKDTENHELCVWNVKEERVVKRVAYEVDPGDSVPGFWGDLIGFSRTRDGHLKFVRVWTPSAILVAGRYVYREVLGIYHGGRWRERTENQTDDPFSPMADQVFRFVAGHLYCVGWRSDAVVVMDYNVETDERVYLPAPDVGPRETNLLENLVIGHGGRGELTACVFASNPTPTCPYGQLRLFSFREGVWQPLRFFNQCSFVRNVERPFVPVFFFLGREDRQLNCVFLKDGDEIVVTSRIREGYCTTRTLFSNRLQGPPRLLACNVASADHSFAQPPHTIPKWNKRAREPDNEDMRRRRDREGLRSFEEND